MRALLLIALGCGLCACIQGREPPDPTPTIPIPAGTYNLGLGAGDALRCSADTSADPFDRCDSGTGGSDVAAYIEQLSWVPAATATLAAFAIDAHEVTNLQYARCVDHGACTEPAYTEAAGIVGYHGDAAYDDHPVVWVSHAQASAYCTFVGGALPTEAQWAAAARGSSGRTFPWGGTRAACVGEGQPDLVVFRACKTSAELGSAVPMAVDYSEKDKTALGVRNMASNVSEWTRDGWRTYAHCKGGAGYNSACQARGQACPACSADGAACATGCNGAVAICTSGGAHHTPTGEEPSAWVVRGGSFLRNRCFHRLVVRRREAVADEELGFRCVFEGGS